MLPSRTATTGTTRKPPLAWLMKKKVYRSIIERKRQEQQTESHRSSGSHQLRKRKHVNYISSRVCVAATDQRQLCTSLRRVYAALKPERNIVSIGQTSLDSIVIYDETVTPHVTCYRYTAPGAAKYNAVYMYISDATLHYQI